MSEGNDTPKTRRSVLKSVGSAAAVGTFVTSVGTAAGDDAEVRKVEAANAELDVEIDGVDSDDLSPEDSWYEYKCEPERCQYGGDRTQYRRHCFEDPEAGTVCGSWEDAGCC